MSAVAAVWESSLPAAKKLIALKVASWQDAGRPVRASQAYYARLVGMDPRTVRRHLAEMVAAGVLSKVDPTASGRVVEYRLDLDVVARLALPPWSATPDTSVRGGGPNPGHQRPGSQDTTVRGADSDPGQWRPGGRTPASGDPGQQRPTETAARHELAAAGPTTQNSSAQEPTDAELSELAVAKARSRPNVRNVDALARTILRDPGDRAQLVEQFRASRAADTDTDRRRRCDGCDDDGYLWDPEPTLAGHKVAASPRVACSHDAAEVTP